MRHLRILLVGYYGKGNFGDDILLKVTHGILREAFAQAELTVLVQDGSGNYVKPMLQGDVQIACPGNLGHFDLIVHGGGGVLFDFGHYGLKDKLLEGVIQAMGYPAYVKLEKLARQIAGKQRTSADCRLAMGVGVGTFSKGSPALRDRLFMLEDLDAIWVRDARSAKNLERFQSLLKAEVIQASDLAFLHEYWKPDMAITERSDKTKLGVILRDWHEAAQLEVMAYEIDQLANDYEVSILLFDNCDQQTQSRLKQHPMHVWQPQKDSIESFSALLAAQDVLLTSRAHGAICGACLGVPSVILEIEPKLRVVHEMLPECSAIVAADQPKNWRGAIEKMLQLPQERIVQDVACQQRLSAEALSQIKPYLQKVAS